MMTGFFSLMVLKVAATNSEAELMSISVASISCRAMMAIPPYALLSLPFQATNQ